MNAKTFTGLTGCMNTKTFRGSMYWMYEHKAFTGSVDWMYEHKTLTGSMDWMYEHKNIYRLYGLDV